MYTSSLIFNFLLLLNLLLLSNPIFSQTAADSLIKLESAAIDGNIEAQSQLASMYYLGEGVEQNLKQAFAWYQLAAEQGDAISQYSLGNLYLLGEGTKLDKQKAIYWYQQAANQGYQKAQTRLDSFEIDLTSDKNNDASVDSNRYAGAPINDDIAETIADTNSSTKQTQSSSSSNKNDPESLFDQLFDLNDASENTINAEEKISEEIKTTEAKTKTTNNPSVTSFLQPGPVVNTETIENESDERPYAVITEENTYLYQLYIKAQENDAEAQYLIGNAYYRGDEIQQNFEQAFLWYRRAAENGQIDAQFQLGNIYLMGEGVSQNDDEALYWYQKAAEQNHPDAIKNYESLKQFSTKIRSDSSN